ncbi:MAG: hypothetical protein KIT31_16305, partial [Deltaproteobacteria bacterium]|nr:hypothetical protein [Deltaproteobacteria bacterium]
MAPILAISHDGKRTLVRDGEVLLLDGAPLIQVPGTVAAALLDGATWIVTEAEGEHTLHRFDGGEPAGPPHALGRLGDGVTLAATRIGMRSALIEGECGVFVREREGQLVVEALGKHGRDRRVLIGGRGVASRRGGELAFLRAGVLGALALLDELAAAATVTGGAIVLDGAGALIELEANRRRCALLFELRGGSVMARFSLGEARILAIAERKGLAVLGRDAHVALLDLRAARCVGERILPAPVAACAIDADGGRLLAIDEAGCMCELTEWSRGRGDAGGGDAVPARGSSPSLDDVASRGSSPSLHDVPARGSSPSLDDVAASPESTTAPTEAPTEPEDVDLARIAALRLVALKPATGRTLSREALDEYLADAHGWIAALCRTALATAWDTGRIARPAQPREGAELEAVLAARGGRATEARTRAQAQEREAAERFSRWNRRGAPHVEVARELGLSPMATTLLLIAAAPQIWGELARAYGMVTADAARPLVDELLLAHLLEAETSTRTVIGRELDEDAPLVASGAVEMSKGLRPYAALAVHPAIARRLAGAPAPADLEGTVAADRALDDIIGPRAAIAA